jgi:hypothetical protein
VVGEDHPGLDPRVGDCRRRQVGQHQPTGRMTRPLASACSECRFCESCVNTATGRRAGPDGASGQRTLRADSPLQPAQPAQARWSRPEFSPLSIFMQLKPAWSRSSGKSDPPRPFRDAVGPFLTTLRDCTHDQPSKN